MSVMDNNWRPKDKMQLKGMKYGKKRFYFEGEDNHPKNKVMKYTPEEFETIKNDLYTDHSEMKNRPKFFLTMDSIVDNEDSILKRCMYNEKKLEFKTKMSFPVVNSDKTMDISDDEDEEEEEEEGGDNADKKKSNGHNNKIKKTSDCDIVQNYTPVVRDKASLFTVDCQTLLLFVIQKHTVHQPRWCNIMRRGFVSKVNIIVVEGVGDQDYEEYFEELRSKNFTKVNMVPTKDYKGSIIDEILFRPSFVVKDKDLGLVGRDGPKETVVTPKKLNFVKKEIVPLDKIVREKIAVGTNLQTANKDIPKVYRFRKHRRDEENISRVNLMLSTKQMVADGYPLPYCNFHLYADYKCTHDKYIPASDSSPMFSIDCEMCMTTEHKLECTRVSVIDETCTLIYDTYVKPDNTITNYLTQYSGITKKIMDGTTTKLCEVQEILSKMIPNNAIICGQSLGADLKSLKMFHPYCIDTSVIYNLKHDVYKKPSLKILAKTFLGRDIQSSIHEGHSSIEDAGVTLDLVKLKMHHGVEFGNVLFNFDMNSDVPVVDREKNSDDSVVGQQYDRNAISHLVVSDEQKNVRIPKKKFILSTSKFGKSKNYFAYKSSSMECIFKEMIKNFTFKAAVIDRDEKVVSRFSDCANVQCTKNVDSNDDVKSKTLKYYKRKEGKKRYCNMIYSTLKVKDLSKKSKKSKKKSLKKIEDMLIEMVESMQDRSLSMVIFSGGNQNEAGDMQSSVCLTKVVSTYEKKVDI